MTRETKIGLLVGLAFIIVIGILLSDHLSSTNQPIPAPLAQAGSNSRSALNAPGATGEPPITSIVSVPETVQSQQPVPTNEDLAARPVAPPPTIHIGPAANPQTVGESTPVTSNTQTAPRVQEAPPVIRHEESAGADGPGPGTDAITRIANAMGEPVVPAGSSQGGTYVAQSGDNLSRMATRFFGSNSKANRDAIVKANPSLSADPNMIIAGRTYNIPSGSTVTSAAATPARSIQPPSATSDHWYTAQEGDSLWRIAQDQLGDGNAYTAIKALNKDILGDSDTIRVGMKLRLPSKPLASAQ